MNPRLLKEYLESRALPRPWEISGLQGKKFLGAVIIPSLAENSSLFSTLETLSRNPGDLLSRFLILVVVNHREDAPNSDKLDNRQTLAALQAGGAFLDALQLGWVGAAPGLELPSKTGGVGLARKIGFDLALARLDFEKASPMLISLDADTLCRTDYFSAIIRHFQNSKAAGAVIPFCHQRGDTWELDQAIQRYELFLRAYVLGLSRACSPYAFHTVGSAMACPAEAYVRSGGMKPRVAGEDFYFLEHLAKVGGIAQVQGTMVYPSARASHRVPFGTGRSISKPLAEEERAVLFYQRDCFKILADWLCLVAENPGEEEEWLYSHAGRISVPLTEYLQQIKFAPSWKKLRQNFRSPSALSKGFHQWFDALKTMKLIHHLSAGPFPRRPPEQVMPEFLQWAGLEPVSGTEQQLGLLRKIQWGSDYADESGSFP